MALFDGKDPKELRAMLPPGVDEKLVSTLDSFKAWMLEMDGQGVGVRELIAVIVPTIVSVGVMSLGVESTMRLLGKMIEDAPEMYDALQSNAAADTGVEPGSVVFGLKD